MHTFYSFVLVYALHYTWLLHDDSWTTLILVYIVWVVQRNSIKYGAETDVYVWRIDSFSRLLWLWKHELNWDLQLFRMWFGTCCVWHFSLNFLHGMVFMMSFLFGHGFSWMARCTFGQYVPFWIWFMCFFFFGYIESLHFRLVKLRPPIKFESLSVFVYKFPKLTKQWHYFYMNEILTFCNVLVPNSVRNESDIDLIDSE